MEDEMRMSDTSVTGSEESLLEKTLGEIASEISDESAGKLMEMCDVKGLRRVFSDVELMTTAECFIRCSLNVSAAARELYMHRNTMMYRLDKIKRTTGLDVRSFDEAVAFRILYKVYRRNNRK